MLLVLALIERFNYVSSWVATRVCMAERTKERTKLVCKLIMVAEKLRQLNNFNGLMEIVSGLNRGPVYRWVNLKIRARFIFCGGLVSLWEFTVFTFFTVFWSDLFFRLKQTFAEIERTKEAHYRIWMDLQQLTSSDKAYLLLRKELRSANPPCIPYLGTVKS